MTGIGNFLIKKKAAVLVFFALALAITAVLSFSVKVNYNSAQYLPEDSSTKRGLAVMYDAFGENGIASVMAERIDYAAALRLKEDITSIEGVESVLWLDDIFSSVSNKMSSTFGQYGFEISADSCTEFLLIYTGVLPEITEEDSRYADYSRFNMFIKQGGAAMGLDTNLAQSVNTYASGFYNDQKALFQVTFSDTDYSAKTQEALDYIKGMEDELYLTGNAAVVSNSVKTVSNQTNLALIIASFIVLIILFAMSGSYFEPVLFITVIGVAIVLNTGTNVFLGEISYMTKSVAAVLQLALTINYSIFLLQRFRQEKESGKSAVGAIIEALKQSFSPISASSLTTICSFIAIMFMSYTIGLDLGIVLAKGVIISYITVFALLPVLIVFTHGLIEKTSHMTFSLSLGRYSDFLIRSRKLLPVLFLALIIPAFIFQSSNSLTYGNEAAVGSEGSELYVSKSKITDAFGPQNKLVILLEKQDFEKEGYVSAQLVEIEGVESVNSYSLLDSDGALSMLGESFSSQFRSQDGEYSRIFLTLDLPEESEKTTEAIKRIDKIMNDNMDGDYFILGDAASALDIRDIVEQDFEHITVISVLLVAVVIMLTFRSLLLPIIMVLVIQAAIWINMSVPFLMGEPIVFIGYLIVSSILLGATIDYAVLLTSNYMTCRKTMDKFASMKQAVALSAKAVLMSSIILTFSGISVSIISTMPSISVFGSAIGRGGISALITVMVLLPQLLLLLDKPILKLTAGKKRI